MGLGRKNFLGGVLSRFLVAFTFALPVSTAALADNSRQIQYGDIPSWVLPRKADSPSAQTGDAPFQIIYQDTQERIANGAEESFNSYRVRILKPEALAIGNININWMPSAGSATVHYVRIIRDGKTVDVLKQEKFKILERAAGLEQSMLDGALTAALQVPGLQVGDELEFAVTIVQATPAFGSHAAGGPSSGTSPSSRSSPTLAVSAKIGEVSRPPL